MTEDTTELADFKPVSLDDLVEENEAEANDAPPAVETTGEDEGAPPAPEQEAREAPAEEAAPDIVGMRNALTAERYKRQLAEQQAQQMQQHLAQMQQAPNNDEDARKAYEDLAFHDPAAAIEMQVNAVREQMQHDMRQQVAAQSDAMMRTMHDDYDDITGPFYEIAAQVPNHPIVQSVIASPHPAQAAYEAAKQILQTQEMQQPDYRERIKEEVRQELLREAQSAPSSPSPSPTSLAPTSLASIPSATPGQSPAYAGPASLDSILDG